VTDDDDDWRSRTINVTYDMYLIVAGPGFFESARRMRMHPRRMDDAGQTEQMADVWKERTDGRRPIPTF